MRKFRLIKKYPGIPYDIDTIIEFTGNNYRRIDTKSLFFVLPNDIENYPEYWEEVIEKDYKILGFRAKVDMYMVSKGEVVDRIYNSILSGVDFESYYLNKLDNYEIYSVKRLSDGEVFIIGDNINVTYSNDATVQKLIVESNKIFVQIAYDCRYHLKDCSKVGKKPLFTTEDKVNIFEDEQRIIYGVHSGFQMATTKLHSYDDPASYYCNNTYWKFFSTKEAGEEYILMNKPCLSINDINGLLCEYTLKLTNGRNANELLKSSIKELAKKKIK